MGWIAFLLILGKRLGNVVGTVEPATQIDHLASLTTEGAKERVFFSLNEELLAAGWTMKIQGSKFKKSAAGDQVWTGLHYSVFVFRFFLPAFSPAVDALGSVPVLVSVFESVDFASVALVSDALASDAPLSAAAAFL